MNHTKFKQILLLIAFGVILYLGLEHIHQIFGVFELLISLLMPFIIGGAAAFIFNVPMSGFERLIASLSLHSTLRARRELEEKYEEAQTPERREHLQKLRNKLENKVKNIHTFNRLAAILLTLVTLFGVLVLVIFVVAPELFATVRMLAGRFPEYVEQGKEFLETYFGLENLPSAGELKKMLTSGETMTAIWDFLGGDLNLILDPAIGFVSDTINGIFNFFVGIVFAIYILLSKEKLGSQATRIVRAYLPQEKAERLLHIASLSYRTFRNFISGQVTEACILGFMFLITLNLFRFPYALLISLLVTVMALIPIFGAFIACAVGMFLLVFENPMQAIWFLVLFLVLQQIEGNFIYPRVVGNSVGLPSMWVLFAVMLGSALMGFAGMLIFIPICSILYALLRENVTARLEKKEIRNDRDESQE